MSNNIFNENYYQQIWPKQGVHRHDYIDSLSNRLIQKYGKCKILDIGTGCGFLVKTLREKGCDAWGLEISNYAIENSCIKEFVRKGDIRDIPFASGFDIVHSQGVWGYFPKEDIQKAWRECKRVGKLQEHTIDYNDTDPIHQYLFSESEQWWKNQFYPKVLVACPNHECKEYAFQRWIDNVKNLTYTNYDILVVDNSPTLDFINKYKNQIPMMHIDIKGGTNLRINASMEKIREFFLKRNYERWMNIESDVIPPKDIIERMLEIGKDADWISHGYPDRNGDSNVEWVQGIGCSMFSRQLIERFGFYDALDNYGPDDWLWNQVRLVKEFRTIELWRFFNVLHLGK